MTKAEKSVYDKEYRARPEVRARERERWATTEHKAMRHKYTTSEKGRATLRRYAQSPKGKAIHKKANASPQSRAAHKRWQQSPVGKASGKRTRKKSPYDTSPKKKLTHWRWQLKRRYNFTEADYQTLLEKQNHVCAICEKKPTGKGPSGQRLHVDHDHVTGQVRGLLCNSCNRGLGFWNDDPTRFSRAVTYLLRFQGQASPN